MSLTNRLALIKERPTGQRLVWNDRTSHEVVRDTAIPRSVVNRDIPMAGAARIARLNVAPNDRRVVFVDFCPGGVVLGRLDVGWLQQGICTFDFFSSEEQWETFQSVSMGDHIVMKRDLQIGQTTRLYAHGRVLALELNENRDRVLMVDWSHEQDQIEVPLIRCNNMVKIQEIGDVEAAMPIEFWRWLAK